MHFTIAEIQIWQIAITAYNFTHILCEIKSMGLFEIRRKLQLKLPQIVVLIDF